MPVVVLDRAARHGRWRRPARRLLAVAAPRPPRALL